MKNPTTIKYSVVNTEFYIKFIFPEYASSDRMLLIMYLGLKDMYGVEDPMLEGKLISLPFQEELKLTTLLDTAVLTSTLYREVQIPAGVTNVSLRHFKTTLDITYDAAENSFTNF